MSIEVAVQIVELLSSPVQRYVGRPAYGPLPEPAGELRATIEIRAGLGVVGDRYFAKRAHRDAAVTVIAAESLPAGVGLREVRRNILLRGADVDALVGATISLDSGAGPAVLVVRRPANPCTWLDAVIAPGSRERLRGRGSVRCEPRTDATLRTGPALLTVLDD